MRYINVSSGLLNPPGLFIYCRYVLFLIKSTAPQSWCFLPFVVENRVNPITSANGRSSSSSSESVVIRLGFCEGGSTESGLCFRDGNFFPIALLSLSDFDFVGSSFLSSSCLRSSSPIRSFKRERYLLILILSTFHFFRLYLFSRYVYDTFPHDHFEMLSDGHI